jgi:hypothetical protein
MSPWIPDMPPLPDDLLSSENLKKLCVVGPTSRDQRAVVPHPRSPRIAGQFLRGPIPMAWLEKAANLPGKGPLAVALAIRFESGRRGNAPSVRLTNSLAARFGVSRKAKYAALLALEGAGLIKVDRSPKRTPTVSIIEVAAAPQPEPIARRN